jgi:hypothetical protein
MRRFFVTAMIGLVFFNFSHCVKYINPPIPQEQRLLTAKPWVLIYTEWVTFDSSNTPNYHFLSSSNCEKQEAITFAINFDYYVKLVCDQSVPTTLVGDWNLFPDSMMGFGSKTTDTSITTALNNARLELITTDSLKFVQQRSFAKPDSASLFYYEMTYAH